MDKLLQDLSLSVRRSQSLMAAAKIEMEAIEKKLSAMMEKSATPPKKRQRRNLREGRLLKIDEFYRKKGIV